MSYLDFNFVKGQGLKAEINKEELEKLMETDKHEEARCDDLEFLEECKSDKDDWDMNNVDYL